MVTTGFNLARRNYRHERRRILLAAATVALLGVLLAAQVAGWAYLRQRDGAIGARLATMEGELRRHQEALQAVRVGLPSEALKRYEARVAAYNQILEAGAFSWTGLLLELERAVPPGVWLTEIQPDLGTGKVALRGTARAFDELARLLRGLEERTGFDDVFLLRQAAKRPATDGPEVLEFSVSFTYRGRPS